MSRNDTGEFELVLGNRQLLSLAAIIVILFGVFFTMGYIVGRNSTPFARAADDAPPPSAGERRPQPAGELVAHPPAPAAEANPSGTQPAQPPAETEATSEARPRPTEPVPPAMAEARAGESYLQVAAVARRDAEILVDTLRRKGFPAMLAVGPAEHLFRVLVGPYRDRDALGKAKSDLEAAGFRNAFVPKL
jgi:cell division septation protein DedD